MDINLMHETRIGDLLEDEGQRLAYVFDPEGKRFFLIDLNATLGQYRELETCSIFNQSIYIR